MGMTIKESERRDECIAAGRRIAVRAGVLEACEFCDEVFDPLGGDPNEAYELGDQLIAEEDRIVACFGGSGSEMRSAVERAVNTTGVECYCARVSAKDD